MMCRCQSLAQELQVLFNPCRVMIGKVMQAAGAAAQALAVKKGHLVAVKRTVETGHLVVMSLHKCGDEAERVAAAPLEAKEVRQVFAST
mmetsp:Transcript_57988/g.135598  ORF Transcript_57988/g.135598 Transcript_57988/m.135598 type:complete len:89 (+) Transcript_57988:1773-2039(+)